MPNGKSVFPMKFLVIEKGKVMFTSDVRGRTVVINNVITVDPYRVGMRGTVTHQSHDNLAIWFRGPQGREYGPYAVYEVTVND